VYIHHIAADPTTSISNAPAKTPTSAVTQRGRRRDEALGDSLIPLRTQ
jgi:hypothetical protein